jgi:hypothetical protein
MSCHHPDEARIPTEAGEAASSIPHLLPFTPSKAARWFLMAQNHFATAKVNSDAVKYTAVLANFIGTELDLVEDLLSHPAMDYAKFKSEVLKRFTESDNIRIHRLLESEEMGDRTPSQFHRHLLKLATPDVSQKMILTLWKTRIPETTQQALLGLMDESVATMTRVADDLHEIRRAPRRHATDSPERIAAAAQEYRATAVDRQNRSGDTRHNRLADRVGTLLRLWTRWK